MTSASCGLRCRVMGLVLPALAGVLFGIGLLVSGMTRPEKVVGFLDVGGSWDPSLLFVIGGAATVYAAMFRLIRRRRREPWLDTTFHLPTRDDIDAPLVIGAAVFGIGWGLAGLCPGAALVAAAAGSTGAIAFVLAMFIGMAARHRAG